MTAVLPAGRAQTSLYVTLAHLADFCRAPANQRREVEADNIHLQFGTVGVLDHGANDGILDFAVVQVDADFVADLKLALWFLSWHARNLPSLRFH